MIRPFLIFFMLGTGQNAAALWALCLTPKLGLDTYMYWRRATIVRKLKRGAESTRVGRAVMNNKAARVVSKGVKVVDDTLTTVNSVDDTLQNEGVVGVATVTKKAAKAAQKQYEKQQKKDTKAAAKAAKKSAKVTPAENTSVESFAEVQEVVEDSSPRGG